MHWAAGRHRYMLRRLKPGSNQRGRAPMHLQLAEVFGIAAAIASLYAAQSK